MKYIEVKDEEYQRDIRLNRAELHNAFNAEMIEELTGAFSELPTEVRAVQLSGAGKSFCAGADLNWMKSMVEYTMEENREDSLKLFDMFSAIRNCRVPVLGKVHGNVFGGGLGLVAACDIVVAEESTKFCFSEVNLGLVPAVISPFVFDKVAEKSAREWMLSGKVFSATEAFFAGLVNHVGTAQEAGEFVDLELNRIISCGREAVSATKALLNQLKGLSWEERRRETARVIAERRVSEEGQEGLRSFLQKKSPDWKVSRSSGKN